MGSMSTRYTADELAAAIAAELRAQRGRARLTIKDVVTNSGLSKSTVLRILNEERPPDLEQLHEMAEAMGTTAADVMNSAVDALQNRLPASHQGDSDGRNVKRA